MKRYRLLALLVITATLLPLCGGCLGPTSLTNMAMCLPLAWIKENRKSSTFLFLLQKEGDSQEAQTGAGSYIIAAEGDNLLMRF